MKLARRGPRARQPVRADINVTPLVDVVLVLLIIFMVVAPIIAQAVPVDLPETVHHERKPDDGQHLVVSVTRTGQVYVRNTPVTLHELPRLIDGAKVHFKGDSRADYGVVRRVMDAIHKATVQDIQLETEELQSRD
jgi:biopolymer transport protein ExbD